MDTTNLNQTSLAKLGNVLREKFDQYVKDRYDLEQRMLKARRQYRGEYDSEIKAKLDASRSQAYPKLTRVKVIGMVSRLMDLLFPRSVRNFELHPTPFPNLSQEDLQKLLDSMPQEVEQTSEIIEKAIFELAKRRCERMSKTVDDQLADNGLDYVTLARKVIFNAVQYGFGVLKGPLVRQSEKRIWKRNPVTARFEASTQTILAPYYEVVSPWAFYPDLKAKSRNSMDGAFERHIMAKHEARQLAERSDFLGDKLKGFLKDRPDGNYVEQGYESEMRGEKHTITSNVQVGSGKYEFVEWWGNVAVSDLQAAGVEVPSTSVDVVMANVWLLGKDIVKVALSPYPANVKVHHIFVYEEDENSVLGTGLPEVVRESQLAAAAGARMLIDNAALSCGLMLEVNTEVLAPGQDTTIRGYKVFEREGTGQEAGIPAVRDIRIDSHTPELISIIDLFQRMMDAEALLPPSLMGDVSNTSSEPYRTSRNTSQLLGAAALPVRDVVRNFDQFTESVMSSLYYWNMEFNDDADIKGDFVVRAVGSTSLVAKEVRSYAIDNLMQTATDDERSWIKTRNLLVERLNVRDLVPEDILKSEEEYQQDIQEQQGKQQAVEQLQMAKVRAEIKEILTRAMSNVASAEAAEVGSQVSVYGQLLSTIEAMTNGGQQSTGSGLGQDGAPAQPQF